MAAAQFTFHHSTGEWLAFPLDIGMADSGVDRTEVGKQFAILLTWSMASMGRLMNCLKQDDKILLPS